ncbi:predicted protein [Streptomyces viridosporus ATCC 14672]|uniref:Predicted protein n=1 Tax=Streptomyces viridosporus (strain ATCC 14672 / DSM 40746 / JCM 4963 / KCTC 9882 / NRRL B-12104 / FH 1290) TaxID=566461 RepID=D6AAG1_STRV1|nr:predicted protein [Streptomyces viridosporus ATCC 14672]
MRPGPSGPGLTRVSARRRRPDRPREGIRAEGRQTCRALRFSRSSPNRPGRRSSRAGTGTGSSHCSGPTPPRAGPSPGEGRAARPHAPSPAAPSPAPRRTPPVRRWRNWGASRADGPVPGPCGCVGGRSRCALPTDPGYSRS